MDNNSLNTHVKTVTITPEMASQWLLKNGTNRPLRKTVVDSIVRDISAGAFRWTHQGIAFDKNGNLVDGQHRLTAVVVSGRSIHLPVWFNVPYGYKAPIDRGLGRTTSDVTGIPETECIIARVLYRLDSNDFQNKRLSDALVEETYYRYRGEILEVLEHSKEIPETSNRRLTGGFYAACVYALPLNTNVVKAFITDVKTGENLHFGNPAMTFREWYNGRLKRYLPNDLACVTLHALNFKLEGKEMQRLKIPTTGLLKTGYMGIRNKLQRVN